MSNKSRYPVYFRSVILVFATFLAWVTGAGVASAEPVAHSASIATVDATYHTWAYGVAVRGGGVPKYAECGAFPSTTNCNWVMGRVDPNWILDVQCQQGGQNINGNPNWLIVRVHVPAGAFAYRGWISSYYIDYPGNVLPVRWCDPGEGSF
jgi:hypothetical protein